MSWCDFSDLPAGQCAHCTGDTLNDPAPARIPGTERPAAYPGLCGCGCRAFIRVGDTIAAADLNNDGDTTWCLAECTTDPDQETP